MDDLEAYLYFGEESKTTEFDIKYFKDIKYIQVKNHKVIDENGKYFCTCDVVKCVHKYICSKNNLLNP